MSKGDYNIRLIGDDAAVRQAIRDGYCKFVRRDGETAIRIALTEDGMREAGIEPRGDEWDGYVDVDVDVVLGTEPPA